MARTKNANPQFRQEDSAGLSAARSVIYLGGANLAGPLTVLAVYAAADTLLTLAAAAWRQRAPPLPQPGQHDTIIDRERPSRVEHRSAPGAQPGLRPRSQRAPGHAPAPVHPEPEPVHRHLHRQAGRPGHDPRRQAGRGYRATRHWRPDRPGRHRRHRLYRLPGRHQAARGPVLRGRDHSPH
jgi:hypothetical protein